jgi:feruloyl esterase
VTKFGFASISSNSGHNGTSAGAFLHQPQVLEDFVWRGLYSATAVGKSVTNELYGRPHKKSYFVGCSQGGRQGFKAAQTHTDMFDGIVAGAPGLNLPGLFQYMTRWLITMGTNVNNMTVSIEKWSTIQNETLRQCDHLDGASDGIIEDTRRCRPDLSKLGCGRKGAPEPCLTPSDLSLVASFFEPWIVNGTRIYTGMTHNGAETTHASTLSSSGPLAFALEWPRFVINQDVSWSLDRWTPADAVLAVQQNAFNFNTWDGDLSSFRAKGGRIIHYHGQVDQVLDSTVSDAYYDHVARTMRARPRDLDEFYRYFRISGLAHCSAGGPGASSLGQDAASPPGGDEPEDNVLMQIVRWVEQGEAPDTLRGAKFVGDDPGKGVEWRRRHCRYPMRNVYKGRGNGMDEGGWKCVM